MHLELNKYIEARLSETALIPADRTQLLDQLAALIDQRIAAGEPCKLTFICTHNSRRSHLCQLWAAAAAAHFGHENVQTYSGGTEATAFNPRAVAALQRAGFRTVQTTRDANPVYHVRYGENATPMTCFSKVYDQAPNPKEAFIAVMTCSHADKACPLVSGALTRVAVTYEDPKIADNTPDEAATYDERCAQIAREMLYVFSKLKAPNAKEA